MANENTSKVVELANKPSKAPAKPTHPDLATIATRLGEIREELDEREQAVLDAEALRDAAKEHWEALHAAGFGAEYGVASGGKGSAALDENGKLIPANWDVLMGDIPEPEEEEADEPAPKNKRK